MTPKIDNQRDYHLAVANAAARIAQEDGLQRPTATHVNQARREVWPQLTDELRGRLVLR